MDSDEIIQPYAPAVLYSPEMFFFDLCYSYLSKAELTPGPSAAGENRQIERKQ
jgi:hypothetical protein